MDIDCIHMYCKYNFIDNIWKQKHKRPKTENEVKESYLYF